MKLKPCPFCGGEAKLTVFLGKLCVACTNCLGAIVPSVGMTKKEAIEAWNRREPIEKIVEQLEEKATDAGEWYNNYEDSYYEGEEDGIREAIEVVKSGGAV